MENTQTLLLSGEMIRMRRCRRGVFAYLRHDQFVGRQLDLYGEKGEAEQTVLDQLVASGHVVVEAGANIGTHTIPLANRVGPSGKVHAIEPQTVVFEPCAQTSC